MCARNTLTDRKSITTTHACWYLLKYTSICFRILPLETTSDTKAWTKYSKTTSIGTLLKFQLWSHSSSCIRLEGIGPWLLSLTCPTFKNDAPQCQIGTLQYIRHDHLKNLLSSGTWEEETILHRSYAFSALLTPPLMKQIGHNLWWQVRIAYIRTIGSRNGSGSHGVGFRGRSLWCDGLAMRSCWWVYI